MNPSWLSWCSRALLLIAMNCMLCLHLFFLVYYVSLHMCIYFIITDPRVILYIHIPCYLAAAKWYQTVSLNKRNVCHSLDCSNTRQILVCSEVTQPNHGPRFSCSDCPEGRCCEAVLASSPPYSALRLLAAILLQFTCQLWCQAEFLYSKSWEKVTYQTKSASGVSR